MAIASDERQGFIGGVVRVHCACGNDLAAMVAEMKIVRTYYPSWQLQHNNERYIHSSKQDVRISIDLQKSKIAQGSGESFMCQMRGGWNPSGALELLTLRREGDGHKVIGRRDVPSVPSVSHSP